MDIATNPTFLPTKPIKILFSPGPGAGWVSWAPALAPDGFLVWMLTYEPMISGLEKRLPRDKLEEILARFHLEAKTKFGVQRIVVARVLDLVVEEVACPFEIRETEGQEKIVDVRRRKMLTVP